jgi:hypothetical protein
MRAKFSQKPEHKAQIVGNQAIISLFDNITEEQTEDGLQYEADMYQMKLPYRETYDFESLLAQAKRLQHPQTVSDKRLARDVLIRDTKEVDRAQAYLDSTDWIHNQMARVKNLHGEDSAEYKELFAKRLPIMLEQERMVEVIRNAT